MRACTLGTTMVGLNLRANRCSQTNDTNIKANMMLVSYRCNHSMRYLYDHGIIMSYYELPDTLSLKQTPTLIIQL